MAPVMVGYDGGASRIIPSSSEGHEQSPCAELQRECSVRAASVQCAFRQTYSEASVFSSTPSSSSAEQHHDIPPFPTPCDLYTFR